MANQYRRINTTFLVNHHLRGGQTHGFAPTAFMVLFLFAFAFIPITGIFPKLNTVKIWSGIWEPIRSKYQASPQKTSAGYETGVMRPQIDTITLSVTIRDFLDSHPDFEGGLCGLTKGLVDSTLGEDGKPVFIAPDGSGSITSRETFNQWYNDVDGVNLRTVKQLQFTETSPGSGIYSYENYNFFPIDNELFGNQGRIHNYHFTLELHTTFTYHGGEVFQFTGDDDLWFFVNNHLAVDLGGVHGPESGSVELDSLNLIPGSTYKIDLFFAERHTTSSEFRALTSIRASTLPVVVLVHGWHGLRRSDTNCITGIVPYTSGYPTDFGMIPDGLVQDGYDVYIAHLDTTFLFTPLIEKNAACLAHQIADVKRATGAQNVILIGHSMGGLVSRAYMEKAGLYQNDVKQLITLGTPHTGTSGGIVGIFTGCLGDQAACEFTPEGMIFFNSVHNQRAKGVPYTFIGGTSFIRDIPLEILDGPSDGAVGVASSQGKIYWAWPFIYHDNPWWWLARNVDSNNGSRVTRYHVLAGHPWLPQDFPNYFRAFSPKDTQRTESYKCIRYVLGFVDENAVCPKPTPDARTQDAPATIFSQAPSSNGHLSTGQVVTHTVLLDTDGTSQFMLTWITGTVGLTLTNPLGTVIDPAYASANPSIVTYTTNTTDLNYLLFAQYTFSETVPGTYTLIITAGDVGPEGTNWQDSIVLDSSRTLTVTHDNLLYAIGSMATITASVQNSGVGLTNAVVEAHLHRPGLITDTVTLIDRGGGIYNGTYLIPAVPGYLGLSVLARGTDGGTSYARQMDSLLAIAPTTVQLNGQYADSPQDVDGNGKYEILNLTIGITSTQAGNYMLSGDLVGKGGVVVAHSVISLTLGAGTLTVTLPFNGNDIQLSRLNGPYTLTNLTVTDQQYAGVPAVWLAQNVWITAVYKWSEFGNNNSYYVPLIVKH